MRSTTTNITEVTRAGVTETVITRSDVTETVITAPFTLLVGAWDGVDWEETITWDMGE